MTRALPRLRDEQGIALAAVVMTSVVLGIIAVSLMGLTSLESDRSRRDVTKAGAYQAAEAGLDAYTADLTEDTGFFLDYVAAGEARRTFGGSQYPATAGANANANVALSPSWGRGSTWSYPTNITTDPAWRTVPGTNFQYLLEIFPDTQQAQNVRIVSIGRPVPSSQNPATDKSSYRAVEAVVRAMSVSDFQMLSASDISYGTGAITAGMVYATVNDAGNPASISHSGTATADLLTEDVKSSYSGSVNLVSPARKYAADSTPTIRSIINKPVKFADLRQSPQIAPIGGGSGAIQTRALSEGITLAPTTNIPNAWWLKFQASGSVDVYSCMKAPNGSNWWPVERTSPTCTFVRNYPLAATGGEDIYSEEDVIVSGVVNGQVTIYTAGNGRASTGDQSYAQGNIVVAGNISYNQPGNDVLGLIAKNSVIIACWQADNNLSWRAATMSLNGTWASDQSVSGSGCTATRGSMTFTGSTATYQGGGMGGYAPRTYNYDPTLRYLPPPDYPQIPASFTVLYQREIPSP